MKTEELIISMAILIKHSEVFLSRDPILVKFWVAKAAGRSFTLSQDFFSNRALIRLKFDKR